MENLEFKELLEKSDDKVSLFADFDTLKRYMSTIKEMYYYIENYLTDEEKFNLIKNPNFISMHSVYVRTNILESFKDEDFILKSLYDEEILKGASSYDVANIIGKLGIENKIKILNDTELLKKYDITDFKKETILLSLPKEQLISLLEDKDFIFHRLKLDICFLADIISKLENDEDKKRLITLYPEMSKSNEVTIIKTFGNENKIKEILNREDDFDFQKESLIASLDVPYLIDFIKNNKEYLVKNELSIGNIIRNLGEEKQKEVFLNIDNMGFSLEEKQDVILFFKKEVKDKIEVNNLKEEYKRAFKFELAHDNDLLANVILVNLEDDLEEYRGFDKYIYLNPEKYNKEEQEKFFKLCEICPDLNVVSSLNKVNYYSKVNEYKDSLKWIESVLSKIDDKYTPLQKIAIIDNEIGKKISYAPDYDTELTNEQDLRAMWKIISTGYGVCNGIARLEQYLLEKVGIESKIVSGVNHAFLKLENLEIEKADGSHVKGNTILDPTWNLTEQRYGAKPDCFLVSYEEIRKLDIDKKGIDQKCHENDTDLKDATLSLEEQDLRNVFKSVGLADKNGFFPIKSMIDKSNLLHEKYKNDKKKNVEEQLKILEEYYPDFASCQNSTMNILGLILLDKEKFGFKRRVLNRVYNKNDKNKKPVLFTFIEDEQLGEVFYYADGENKKFISLSKKEFENQFECYSDDLNRANGRKPWDEKIEEKIDLTKSSGNVIAVKKEGHDDESVR